MTTPASIRPLVLVAGLDRFGLAVVRELCRRGAEVGVIASADAIGRHEAEVDRLGIRTCAGAAHSPKVLVSAEIERAAALVLTADDDADNIDAAIAARLVSPTVRIVGRVFAPELAEFVRETLPGVSILSVSQVAAPIFADLASRLEETTEAAVPASVLESIRSRSDRAMIALGAVFIGVASFGVLYFRAVLGLSIVDAIYFVGTTISTTGFGDISLLREGPFTKLVGLLLMFSGAGLLAIFYGLVSSWFIQRRLDAFEGRVPVRGSGHVIVCGAGNVGYRVAQQLHARGDRLVVIEQNPYNHNAEALRVAGHHVIRADATSAATLRLAHVERARVVLALTDDDTSNLRIARIVEKANPAVPVVLRILSADLAAHVDLHAAPGRVRLLSPFAAAAGRFAAAALEGIATSARSSD